MRNTRAFTLTDLLALIVVLTLLLAVAAAAGKPPARANPFPNYAAIAQAAGPIGTITRTACRSR